MSPFMSEKISAPYFRFTVRNPAPWASLQNHPTARCDGTLVHALARLNSVTGGDMIGDCDMPENCCIVGMPTGDIPPVCFCPVLSRETILSLHCSQPCLLGRLFIIFQQRSATALWLETSFRSSQFCHWRWLERRLGHA